MTDHGTPVSSHITAKLTPDKFITQIYMQPGIGF
jgi:hypothetical protein